MGILQNFNKAPENKLYYNLDCKTKLIILDCFSTLSLIIYKKHPICIIVEKGIEKIAQKVGEEAVETVIEALRTNDELFLNESADLLFHYLILLQAKGFKLDNVLGVLADRRK